LGLSGDPLEDGTNLLKPGEEFPDIFIGTVQEKEIIRLELEVGAVIADAPRG